MNTSFVQNTAGNDWLRELLPNKCHLCIGATTLTARAK